MHGLGTDEASVLSEDGGAMPAAASEEDGADGFEIVLGEPIVEETDVIAKNAHDIAFILSAFAGWKPRLAGRLPDIEVRVAAALLDVGRTLGAERVRVLSMGALRSCEDALPVAVAAELRTALEDAVVRVAGGAIAEPLGGILDAALSAPVEEVLGDGANARLAEIVQGRAALGDATDPEGIPDALTALARTSLRHALRLQIGFTLAEMPSHRDAAVAFIDLFECGNLPLGLMADGSFLVLTA